ncbi:recombinase family protein [Bacillus salitolerans]|uniref:Recombinase family protein n=1 Tax=Bacillus salitolerans TaxID=1437434 RepID=A0ABW4LJK4_9BACI
MYSIGLLKYESKNKKLKLIPEEAKVVKYIFEKYANELWVYRKIASSLNTQVLRQKMEKDGLKHC